MVSVGEIAGWWTLFYLLVDKIKIFFFLFPLSSRSPHSCGQRYKERHNNCTNCLFSMKNNILEQSESYAIGRGWSLDQVLGVVVTLGARVRSGGISSFWLSAWDSAPLGESHALTERNPDTNNAGSLSTQCGKLQGSLPAKDGAPVHPRFRESHWRKGERGHTGLRDLGTREVGAHWSELQSMGERWRRAWCQDWACCQADSRFNTKMSWHPLVVSCH